MLESACHNSFGEEADADDNDDDEDGVAVMRMWQSSYFSPKFALALRTFHAGGNMLLTMHVVLCSQIACGVDLLAHCGVDLDNIPFDIFWTKIVP